MSLKLEKIAAEREKARRKRDEWEERRKEWDRKYHEQENSEICEMVHAQSLTPEQLAVIIQMAQAAVPNSISSVFARNVVILIFSWAGTASGVAKAMPANRSSRLPRH